jgi:hypothetical protein
VTRRNAANAGTRFMRLSKRQRPRLCCKCAQVGYPKLFADTEQPRGCLEYLCELLRCEPAIAAMMLSVALALPVVAPQEVPGVGQRNRVA